MSANWRIFIQSEESASSQIDPVRKTHRWFRVGEWILLVLLVAQFCVRTVPKAWQTLNTDFPDYYFPAKLAHQHYDTSRVYEWIWLERQQEHHEIGAQFVNLVPSTLFSTLVLYPLTGLPVLAAKHWWLIFNFGLLLATLYLLRSMTQLPWRRIALVAALSFALRANFVTGQYYVLLLFLLTLACYLYLRQKQFLSGVMVGIAAGLKIFPAIYLLYFLRKRDWKALAGGVAGGLSSAVVSVGVFGWEANRTYLSQILPWTLRGDTLSPYVLKIASFSTLLHRLFIYEPQLNPHPAIHAAWLFAVLHPLLQMMVVAPALLLAVPKEQCVRRIRLEWVAILLASLAISTSPQSYLFTLLILVACVVLEVLQRERSCLSIAIMLALYVAAGYVSGTVSVGDGWNALLGVSRLYVLLVSCVLVYMLLIREQRNGQQTGGQFLRGGARLDRSMWAVALSVVLGFSIFGNLRHQRGLYDDYRWRIDIPKEAHMAVHPAVQGDALLFVAMLDDSYHLAMERDGVTTFSEAGPDQLAVTAAKDEHWVEKTGKESTIVSTLAGRSEIQQAESPVASFDGRWLAYLREEQGRARIWVRSLEVEDVDRAATPPEFNVSEMSFKPDGDLIFAAAVGGRSGLFTTNAKTGSVLPFGVDRGSGEARYPAVSPDGHWLAYSELEDGNWNLWLRDLSNGQIQRVTHAACNATEPAWDADSRTLIYASDCGRPLWFYALSRRRVVP